MNNLYQITKYIESICKSLPNTGDVYDGSIFQLNEQQNINYPAFVITNRQHLLDRDNETLTYNFAIFAVDRLTSDKENKLDVQSWAIQSLQYIAEKIEDVPALVQLGTIDCFEDRFDSLTAGAYLNLQFNVNAVDCGDNIIMPTGECILQPLRVTENGIYTPSEGVDGFDVVNVNVQPKLERLDVKLNHWGYTVPDEPDPEDPTPWDDIDGWKQVYVDIPTYEEGRTFTKNGHYEMGYLEKKHYCGWTDINVDVQPVLNPIEIFQNGTYMPDEDADGYDKVVVNVPDPDLTAVQEEYNANGNYTIDVPDGYDGLSGVEVRVNVEPILQTLEVTENGEYFPDDDYDGYSSVFVDVRPNVAPQDITITDNGAYHYDAQAEGYDGYSIVDITVNVPEPVLNPIEIFQNGEYVPDEGVDGFNKVVVNVPDPQLIAISKEYNENGNYTIDVPTNFDGISGVEVEVNVQPELEELSVTENGEFFPEKYGYSSVNVNVPSVTTQELTQAEYDALEVKDNNVIYLIKE